MWRDNRNTKEFCKIFRPSFMIQKPFVVTPILLTKPYLICLVKYQPLQQFNISVEIQRLFVL